MHASLDWYGGYPDARDGADYGMGIGDIGALAYSPDLNPVGSGSQGTYYPRDTSGDAAALNFLGFYPEPAFGEHVGTFGSQSEDMAEGAGAWDTNFQAAVRAFQTRAGLGADGWIGPNTRRALKVAVDTKNAQEMPSPFPIPPPPPPPLPNILPGPGPAPGPAPGPVPGPQPVAAKPKLSTAAKVGIGVAAVAGLGIAYAVFAD